MQADSIRKAIRKDHAFERRLSRHMLHFSIMWMIQATKIIHKKLLKMLQTKITTWFTDHSRKGKPLLTLSCYFCSKLTGEGLSRYCVRIWLF